MEEVIFTSAGLLDLLSQIDELKDYDMHLDDNNGAITLTIGDSTYAISKPTDEVEIPEEALEEISDIASDTVDSFDEEPEAVESGIVKEALKTLLVGGAVRLVAKILK
jgi:hypothetical protein